MSENYRRGAIGALLDEYETIINDLKTGVTSFANEDLPVIFDKKTADENCRSVQGILTHVVSFGFGYATSIHNNKFEKKERPPKIVRSTVTEYLQDLDTVFIFTERALEQFSDDDLEQLDNSLKIKTGWGQLYDIEQLMEHAIVHILRHRRQLEKIIQNNF